MGNVLSFPIHTGPKNIRLASHFIPKKYWDWLPEGKILEQEAKK